MVSSFWGFIGVVVVLSIISDGVVKIIKASQGGSSKGLKQKVDDVEEDLAQVELELDDAKRRIEVLEKIVTDDKGNLSRQIDDLANNG